MSLFSLKHCPNGDRRSVCTIGNGLVHPLSVREKHHRIEDNIPGLPTFDEVERSWQISASERDRRKNDNKDKEFVLSKNNKGLRIGAPFRPIFYIVPEFAPPRLWTIVGRRLGDCFCQGNPAPLSCFHMRPLMDVVNRTVNLLAPTFPLG
jgi:hypothetical protein